MGQEGKERKSWCGHEVRMVGEREVQMATRRPRQPQRARQPHFE